MHPPHAVAAALFAELFGPIGGRERCIISGNVFVQPMVATWRKLAVWQQGEIQIGAVANAPVFVAPSRRVVAHKKLHIIEKLIAIIEQIAFFSHDTHAFDQRVHRVIFRSINSERSIKGSKAQRVCIVADMHRHQRGEP